MGIKERLKKIEWGKLIVSLVACQAAGLVGAMFTVSSVGSWYQTLNKPDFTPPSWVFGPVWTSLYVLMGISAYLIWVKGWDNQRVKIALISFLVQLFLNAAWSFSFFGLQNPYLGLVNILILLVMIVVTMVLFFTIRKSAAWLLLPYLLWVSYATALNYAIYSLNQAPS